MSDIDEKEIDKLAQLCRIECTEEEKKALQIHLNTMIHYIAKLEKLDVSHVNPCYRVLETLNNVMREDLPGETLSRELFLANAPSHVGGLIRVPPVIHKN